MNDDTTGIHVERWDIFEISSKGPQAGNPFGDVTFGATLCHGERTLMIDGFYDGDGLYRVRFMPDAIGVWQYTTVSNVASLSGISGRLVCTEDRGDNHGPVRINDTFHFAYADGNRYLPFGTACYAWHHQGDALEAETLETLRKAPFNKLRMCVFPKHYAFNENEPTCHAFPLSPSGKIDATRFNPRFFQHLEKRVNALRSLGIEADLVLFHPYDRWGYAEMTAEEDERYLRYLIARLSAYRNVWWSMANEYDLMTSKTGDDWDRYFRLLETADPYHHLRSIHNCARFFDHGKSFVTHCSIQNQDVSKAAKWRRQYQKPVVVDECGYEGNVEFNWGDLTPMELVNRMWGGIARGCYVGHGETYLHPADILWWSKGGTLKGESLPRIRFLRQILEETPGSGLNPIGDHWNVIAAGVPGAFYLHYFGAGQPRRRFIDLPTDIECTIDIIDAWDMTVSPLPGIFAGRCEISLPGKPYIALRIRSTAFH
jgi:hypothetical protein